MAREDTPTARLTVETYAPVVTPTRSATLAWWLVSAGGAVICAIAGWSVITALVMIAQLGQTGEVTATALELSTRVWLLSHGGVLSWAGATITLIPLGLTAVIALMIHSVAVNAGKQIVASSGPQFNRGAATAKIVAVLSGVYTIVVVVATLVVDPGGPNLRAGLGALALSAVLGFFAARKAVKWDFHLSWPVWAQAVPRAMFSGALIAVIGGTVALVAALIRHRDQVVAMTDQLDPGWVGGVVLALVQFFYVVNIVAWSMSWTFGPGFTLGDGSFVSLVGSQVGLLPALPVTAALPTAVPSAWSLLWLAFPVLAGAGAAVVVLRARPRARFDETGLVGGLAGLLSGLVVAGLALVTRGDLGVLRLAGLGPIMAPLLIIAPSTMGLGGMVTGVVAGLSRRPKGEADPRWWSHWKSAGDDAATVAPPDPGPATAAIPPRRVEEQPPLDFFADQAGSP